MSSDLAARALTELGRAPLSTPPSPPLLDGLLPARSACGGLAWSAVVAADLASGGDGSTLDAERVAVAYRSDRYLRVDGTAPDVWSPLSGFWRTRDGWVRTHANYPHHARRLRAAFDLASSADGSVLSSALAGCSTADVLQRVEREGGLAVGVRQEDPAVDAALRAAPVFDITHSADARSSPPRVRAGASNPVQGRRVLDLTRVIAGPVATRTLALWGADVLRIDSPELPEPEWQHLDTGHGKRSALLDVRDARIHDLLAGADAVVLGYRPAAMRRRGLDPETLAERYPGLVVAQLSAWGLDHPDRAGFDSLVQAESGIAMAESSDDGTPGALPAQALDHSTGYLLAAAVARLLARRDEEGGSWAVHTSLRRIAAELLGMPRRDAPLPRIEPDGRAHTTRFVGPGVDVTTAQAVLPRYAFSAPRPFGRDAPRW